MYRLMFPTTYDLVKSVGLQPYTARQFNESPGLYIERHSEAMRGEMVAAG